jgi:hypothetical protein
MSAGDVGDPSGQQGPQDAPSPSEGQPQFGGQTQPGTPPLEGGQPQFGGQPQPGTPPPYGGQPQPGQPQYGTYGPPPGAYGPPPGGYSGGPYGPPPGGYSGTGPYGQPGPYGWPARPTNSLAIAALSCGIGQIIAGPLAGIPAIILGFMSMSQIERSGEQGRGMAITGAVLGIVGTILFIVLILFIVAAFHRVEQGPPGFGPGTG